MSTEILFSVSFVLLCLGWFVFVQQRQSRRLNTWRKLLAWVGPIALTISLLLFALFLFLAHRAEATDDSFSSRLDVLLPIVRLGFWTATGATIISFFGTSASRVLFVVSGSVIWILWLAQAMGL